MKNLFTLFVVFVGLLCFTGCGGNNESMVEARPEAKAAVKPLKIEKRAYNVLLITLDTFRRDRWGVYSDKHVKTPNIDALASKSFLFERAFSHNPVTLPAHVNILTGATPLYHGISDNTGFRLEERFLTMAEHLKHRGYGTGAFIGAFPLDSRFGLSQGFDVYDDNYGTHNAMELFFVERRAEQVIGPAMKWISACRGKWFAWIHLFDAHQAYMPPPPYQKQYANDLYSGEAAYVDASLKVLFDFLDKRGLMENTVVLMVGDHGEALGEKGEETHSYFAYNNTIHVPMLLYIPGSGSGTVAGNVCHADIFPTFCDILGIDTPAHLQGESMLPIMAGRARKNRDIYFESLTPYLNRGWAPLRGFVRGGVKFIDLPIPEVYNIKDDLNETRNIASGSNLTQMKRDLVKLKLDLKGKYKIQRSKKVDGEVSRKLKSLGYLSGTASTAPKTFTKAHDLKTLLPLQNRMLAAVADFQAGRHRRALTELQKVVDESPAFVLVYRHMASIYKELGQVRKAVAVLEDALKKNPGNINLLSKLGIMLAEANQAGKAIEVLNVCVKKESFNPENYNFLGVAYYKKGNFNLALENYRKALELDTNYASAFNNIGSLYLVVFMKQKDERAYRLALQHFNRAIEIDPRLFAAYNGRGAAYKFKKQVYKAIADWQKTIEINPNFPDAYFNLGVAYLETGQKAAALDVLTRCKQKFETRLPRGERQRLARLLAAARR
jgi:arylsulfatase A-like enzyme/Tfp pilus assembly protein PilF